MNKKQKTAFENTKRTAQNILSESKSLCPVAISEIAVVALPTDAELQQTILANMAKAPWFIAVNEVWVYPQNQRDQKREAIMIALFEGSQIVHAEQCLFRRDHQGDIYFEDWIDLTAGPFSVAATKEGVFGAI